MRFTISRKIKCCGMFILALSSCYTAAFAQNAYFIDGYHGGIYGHYPENYTRFIIDKFNENPQWKISLEIEPETWDSVSIKDKESYETFRKLVQVPVTGSRIEFTNPAYGQAYLYNIPGESIIRQFTYGIRSLRKHFPEISFTTYAVEEPCFSSCLPQILKSLGFRYAVIRCPNTCWGGYPAAFGGELVNWTGPDGTKIISVPRYACEGLQENSVWQTESWNNSVKFINKCFKNGISHPVGMTYQDAGWRGGPWLGNAVKDYYKPSIYETWRNYIGTVTSGTPEVDWRLSQEDIRVSLVWGSQVLQKLAQQVRAAENRIIVAEKLASIAATYKGYKWPGSSLDEAWRTLLLSQHHDCWIVPYNGRPGNTWADKVKIWTGSAISRAEDIINESVPEPARETGVRNSVVRVYNSAGTRRAETISVVLPAGWNSEVQVIDSKNKVIPSQVVARSNSEELIFVADVPAMGYNTWQIKKAPSRSGKGAVVEKMPDGTFKMETDLYRLIIDPSKGGTIRSLVAKKLGGKEFSDQFSQYGFNELRGNFFNDGGILTSGQMPATITVLENGPVRIKVEINGSISGHPFTQSVTMTQGQKRIDMGVRIDWQGNPGIGNGYSQLIWQQNERRKAFYENRDKLLVLFPLNLQSQKVYVNAPFDVTESRLEDTFFSGWDSIKNDIVLNWLDITDGNGRYGMTLFTDHTTSYVHGPDFPAGLTLQYSGIGLWGRKYTLTGPAEVKYSILPHKGKWDEAGIWTEGVFLNEPLTAVVTDPGKDPVGNARSLIDATGTGFEISSITVDGKALFVRLFNAEGDSDIRKISFDGRITRAEMVELSGEKIADLKTYNERNGRTSIDLSMPRFAIRTVKISGILPD